MTSRGLCILHVCPRPKFSGLEAWVLEMIRFQASRGVRCALVALEGSPLAIKAQDAAAALEPGALTIRLVNEASGARGVSRATRELARDVAPDVLHLHGSQDFNALMPWLARERLAGRSRRTILQLHIWLSHSKRDPLHALTYRLIDEIWVSSEPARREALRLLPIPERKLRVLRYGRPTARFEGEMAGREAARAELGLPADAIVVGTVSRIDRGKGSAELLEGTLRAMATEPKLHLSIVGGPTDDPREIAFAEALRARAAALPESLRARAHFHGMVAGSHRILKAFDLFALPTYRECFSLALMEAQLAGLPCIATDAGGSPELVREAPSERQTGWLCAPESADAFAAALGRALAERAKWAECGERARQRVRAEYELEPALAETISGYEQLIKV